MHVLGHDHIRPEVEAMFLACGIQRFDEPFPGAISVEELKAMVTRECEFACVAFIIVATPTLLKVTLVIGMVVDSHRIRLNQEHSRRIAPAYQNLLVVWHAQSVAMGVEALCKLERAGQRDSQFSHALRRLRACHPTQIATAYQNLLVVWHAQSVTMGVEALCKLERAGRRDSQFSHALRRLRACHPTEISTVTIRSKVRRQFGR